MKKLVLILSVAFCGAVHAESAPDWQQKLEAYKASLEQATPANLRLRYGFYVGAALTTCALSTVITGATFVADTLPLTNLVSESLANVTSPDYQTYQNILEWENIGNIGRGVVGGGPVAVVQSLQFVVLWLGGNEAQAFQAVAKTYASTVAAATTLFAEQGQCMMNISKVMLTRAELKRRPIFSSPVELPADLVYP